MADRQLPDNQSEVGTSLPNAQSTTRSALLKRNPHLRDGNMSSPGFGGLGTRQFLQKQLMTPGSATSASSFEEGASYDGFSDEGTPDGGLKSVTHQRVFGSDGEGGATQYVTRTVNKQPTKRLSSPSRESLARRLMGTSTDTHGMVESGSARSIGDNELPPSDLLTNLVVKRVPSLNVAGIQATTSVPLSPRSTKVTRRIVASPRNTLRRRVVRKTGTDGKVHEVVQYVDDSGKVVNKGEGNFFEGETSETSSGQTTMRRISSQKQTLRRVVVRKTGADGQVHEEVQYLDADGNVVERGDAKFSSTVEGSTITSSSTSTPTRTTTTRRIVTPSKLTRRILRRTGADGQVHEVVQYLDVDGNIVESEGGDATTVESAPSSTTSTSVTHRVVTPSKTIRRVIVRRTGADGQVHEEVQYMDVDGNVVQSDGSALVRTSSFTSSGRGESTSSTSGLTTVTRVVTAGKKLRRVLIRRTGADGQVREEVQYVDADGNVVSSEGGDLSSSGSFRTEETTTEDSAETPGRRKITRRVIRRMLVRKDGTRVAVDQYVDADGQVIEGDEGTLVSAGSFTGSVSSVTSETSTGTPSRRTITRRVMSPGRVVRRMVVHKASSSSGAESEDEVQYSDGQTLSSEVDELTTSGSYRKSSVTSESTPGRRVITRRVVTPQRVVRRMVTHKGTSGSNQEDDGDDLDIDAECVQSSGSSDESVDGSSRGDMAVTFDGVIPRSETRRVVSRTTASSTNQPQEARRVDNVASEADDGEVKAPIPTIESSALPSMTVPGVGSVTTSVVSHEQSIGRDGEVAVAQPEEGTFSTASVNEPSVTTSTTNVTTKPHAPAGGFWNMFGKSEQQPTDIPGSDEDEVPTATDNLVLEESSAPVKEEPASSIHSTESVSHFVEFAQQQTPDAEDDNIEQPQVTEYAEVVPIVDDSQTSASVTDGSVPEVKSDDSRRNEGLIPATVAGLTGAAVVTTTAVAKNLTKPESEPAEHTSGLDASVVAVPEDMTVQTGDAAPFERTETKEPIVTTATSTGPTQESSENLHRPRRSSGGGFWGFFGRSEEEPEDSKPVSSEQTTAPVTATLPASDDQIVEGTSAKTTEPQLTQTSHVETRKFVQDAEQQHPGDNDGSIDEIEGTVAVVEPVAEEEEAPVFASAVETPGADVVVTPSHIDEEAPTSPKHSILLPVITGATAGIVTAAGLANKESVSQPERQEPSEVSGDESGASHVHLAEKMSAPETIVTTTTTTEVVEEESSGGFWGFFGGKSEPKEAPAVVPTVSESMVKLQQDEEGTEIVPGSAIVEEVADATEVVAPEYVVKPIKTPSSPASVTQTENPVNEAQQEVPVSHDGELENPEGVVSYVVTDSDQSDEDKMPVPSNEEVRASIVYVPEPELVAKVNDDDSGKSPRNIDSRLAVPVAAIAGVTSVTVVSSLSSDTTEDHPTDSGKVDVAASAARLTPAFEHPGVDTMTDTSATTNDTEELSDAPRQKAGRSIWTFWGGREKDKPKSPLREDEEPTDRDRDQVISDVAAVPVATTTLEKEEEKQDAEFSGHTPVPSTDEARAFWHQQDEHNPTQVSYAAAVGARYGPESKFELMPTSDKTHSPVAKNQGAIDDLLPNEKTTQGGVVAPTGAAIMTEITQTTVIVEEEEQSFAVGMHSAADQSASVTAPAVVAATAADIEAVAHSQQPIERESTDLNINNSDKPATRGGFWGFLGKKNELEEENKAKESIAPAAGMTTVEAFDTSRFNDHESEDGKLPADQIEAEDSSVAAAALTVPQVESVRRSIPSADTPKRVAVTSVVTGKPIRDSDRRTTLLIDGAEPDMELGADDHYVEVHSPRHVGHEDYDEGAWAVQPRSIEWNKLRLNRKSWKNAPEDMESSGMNEAVLNEVSGSVKSGEFLVITGPSKGESLALLSCLAGYEDAMEGNVTVNGRTWNAKMDRYIAYIMREDLFYETLTVYEHLLVQAQLRMRRTHSDEMCMERVERVIEDMGLSKCRDKLIGGGISLHGISRGERKLLAIATGLLTNPSILLAEEPTDGLDTFSAEKIVAKLRWLAFEKGMTVAVTLHHPSSHFYGLFDVLYLVADGSCVYDGKAADCVAYFATIGYRCPEYMSPMDYFMLQIVVGDRASDDEGVARVEMLKREWSQRNAAVYAENEARAVAASEDAVVDAYDQKNRYYHMGCCGQLWLLWARHVRRLSRYGFVFWWHLLAALLVGVVFGLVYLQLDLNDQKGIQNFAGAFFYIVVVQMLFIAYRTFVFMPRETAIALRERREYRGGWYHLLCWYFTKIVAELPALIILSIMLFVPVFLLVGIGHGFKVYVYMQIVIVLAGWAAISLAFLTLGVLRKVTLALIVYSVMLVLFVAFGGLLINVTDIPDWLVWLHYISPVKYGYEALMKIFWKRVDSIDCDWTDENCVALTGNGVLKYYSMENRSALGDSLILLGICLALFFVAFWFLLLLAKKRVNGLQWRYDWTFKGALGSRRERSSNVTLSQKGGAVRSSMNRVIGRKSYHSSSAAVERSITDGDNHYIRVETPRAGGRGFCDAPSITLGWSSLWLKAPADKKTKAIDETQHKQYLLSDASGSAKCGELILITGPSSKANVALLESLGGQQKRLRGKVTMNGVPTAAQKIVESSAYVPRDDLFYETLTVQEHLEFQAQLCVGKSSGGCGLCCSTSAGDLEAERVEMVLDELELTAKRHMLIRYLSPADTKLLAVATGLLSNPSILLVEEPTYDMDFFSSQLVVLKLRQLARGGRTVVVSMAHPSSHLYALFDVLYLLAGGAAVYHGKVTEAVSYFASLGYQCPQYMSPVDYFIRQVSARNKDHDSDDGQILLFKEAWSTRYSELCLTDADDGPQVRGSVASYRRRIGCRGQLSLLFSRHVLRLRRYHVVFGWHAFWMIILGVIFGLIFLQLDLDDQQDIQNWAGAFFFLIVLQMLVIAYRTFVFLPREMAIAEREHRGGRYYLVCWYLTKVFAELPALLVLSVLLFVPAYLLIGIGHGFKVYFYMQLVMWLAAWSAAGLATLLLGLFRHLRVALIVYALVLVLFVVFGGLLVNVDDVPDYLIWLHYISPVKYGYEAMMKLCWGRIGLLVCGDSDGSGSGSTNFATVGDDASFSMSGSGSTGDDCIAHSGYEVLTHYSMETSRKARSDTIILLELTVLFFFIGYAFLSLRWRRYKTRQSQHPTN